MKTIFETSTHKIEIPDGAVVTQPSIRRITTKAWYRRLSVVERKTLRISTADKVADLREDLMRSPYVNLDNTFRAELEGLNLLSAARVTALLEEGTAEETQL